MTLSAGAASLGIQVEIVERNPAERGFVPQPKRWVAEQTYGTLMLHTGWCATTSTARPAPNHACTGR